MRAVFDTKIVVSALVFGAWLAWLRRAWSSGSVTPVVCRPTVDELIRVLSCRKFRLDNADIDMLLADYLPYAEVAILPERMPSTPAPCRDRGDVIFIQLALSAAVDTLVTGDADLLVLREALLPLHVLSAMEFQTGLRE